jgi:hypothetical protein
MVNRNDLLPPTSAVCFYWYENLPLRCVEPRCIVFSVEFSIFFFHSMYLRVTVQVDVCCFDKTGTLTSDDLLVDGVAGCNTSGGEDGGDIVEVYKATREVVGVLSACHALSKNTSDGEQRLARDGYGFLLPHFGLRSFAFFLM